MGKGKKKEPLPLFVTYQRPRSPSPEPVPLEEGEELAPGEMTETAIAYTPGIPKMEAALTVQWRLNAEMNRGDTVTLKLGGFKGTLGGAFTLEPRGHPENKDFHEVFDGYWSGEAPPKGGPAAQSLIFRCKKTIEPDTLVIVGVPDAVHVVLPDKLASNSTKIKIEAVVRKVQGGKVPKASVLTSAEVKKRPIEEDLAELEALRDEAAVEGQLDDEEAQFGLEVRQQAADQILEAVHELSCLRMGMYFRMEPDAFTGFEQSAQLVQSINEGYMAAAKERIPLALHREIAKNAGCGVGAVVVLEDALYAKHGAHYPNLPRSSILAMRLWSCERVDVCRLLAISDAPCINREVLSAMRLGEPEAVKKWIHFIGAMMISTERLTKYIDRLPPLYRGVKDLSHDALAHIQSLQKDSWYVFPQFTTYTADSKWSDDNFPIPESAVIFEVRGPVEGLEIGDASQYPHEREWLLPMFSSFAVHSVTQLPPEQNSALHVVLVMRGTINGAMRDELFPEEARNVSSVVIRKARQESLALEVKTQALAHLIYCNLQLNASKLAHPEHSQHQVYLAKWADGNFASQARTAIASGRVRWQQQLVQQDPAAAGGGLGGTFAGTSGGVPGGTVTTKPGSAPGNSSAAGSPPGTAGGAPEVVAAWDDLNKRHATVLEHCLLKMTRQCKIFEPDAVTKIDLKEFTADFGKGPRQVRRYIDKSQSHPFVA